MERIERLCWMIVAVAFVNWFGGFIACAMIGGDGWIGYVQDGHYFVGSHGVYTEVSRAAYIYTKVQVVLSVVLMVPGMFAGVLAALLRERRLELLQAGEVEPPRASRTTPERQNRPGFRSKE